MKNKTKVDYNAETHRNRSDCTCYYCMQQETRNYLNSTNMRVTKEKAQEVSSAWNNQKNDELYNNRGKERCSSCGYIKGGTACRKKCDKETGGRYSWLFILIALVIAYHYLKL